MAENGLLKVVWMLWSPGLTNTCRNDAGKTRKD